MYDVSHATKGREMVSQRRTMWEGVWDQEPPVLEAAVEVEERLDGPLGFVSAVEDFRGELLSILLGEAVGSGVPVVLVGLLGERSGGGKLEGWLRVETMVSVGGYWLEGVIGEDD